MVLLDTIFSFCYRTFRFNLTLLFQSRCKGTIFFHYYAKQSTDKMQYIRILQTPSSKTGYFYIILVLKIEITHKKDCHWAVFFDFLQSSTHY